MLNNKQTQQLIVLLKKITSPGQGLPLPVFKTLSKIVPFVACELLIVNNRGEFLLIYRKDEFWDGWHFPGGLMRYNETFEKRLRLTLKHELGVKLKTHKFLFPINYLENQYNRRGQNISLVFLCKISGTPKTGKWFKTQPANIIAVHKTLWRQARKFVKN